MRQIVVFMTLALLCGLASGQPGSPVYPLYSVAPSGAPGNGDSGKTGVAQIWTSTSPIGPPFTDWVVFDSEADNLVPGDTNGVSDIFAFNTTTGQVSLLSRGLNGPADGASSHVVGAGYRYVLYQTDASNIVAGDTNGVRDIILHDILTGVNYGLTQPLNPNGDCSRPFTRPEWYEDYQGNHWQPVLFESTASNLVPNDTNGFSDIFKMDPLDPATVVRVSKKQNGTQADGPSFHPVEFSNGVAFETEATNLFGWTDGNGSTRDVAYVAYSDGGVTSYSQTRTWAANGPSYVTTEHRAFLSDASNVVPGDTNGVRDVFAYTSSGLKRISLGVTGNELDGATTSFARQRFATSARNAFRGDTTPGDEVVRDFAGLRAPTRELSGVDWSEPQGQSIVYPDATVTNAPNVNGGSRSYQVLGLTTGTETTKLLVVSREDGGSRLYGAYGLDSVTDRITGYAQWGRLDAGWKLIGSDAISPGNIDCVLYHAASRRVAVWSIRGMRPVRWTNSGTLAPGWTAAYAAYARRGNEIAFRLLLYARRTSDHLIADYPIEPGRLGTPQLWPRLAGPLLGIVEDGLTLAGFDDAGRQVALLRRKTLRGTVAPGWDVIHFCSVWPSVHTDDHMRLFVRRRTDGRLGYYSYDQSGIVGWRTLPAISAALTLEHITEHPTGVTR